MRSSSTQPFLRNARPPKTGGSSGPFLAIIIFIIMLHAAVFFYLVYRKQGTPYRARSHTDAEAAHLNELIARVNSGPYTWQAKYNPNALLYSPNKEIDELNEKLIHVDLRSFLSVRLNTGSTASQTNSLLRANFELPAAFDARQKWFYCHSVHQLPAQGLCGSCWALAASAVMSDRLCIGTAGADQRLVSADDLLSCCAECGGCGGNLLGIDVFLYWQNVGVVSGGQYGSHEGCRPYSIPPRCTRDEFCTSYATSIEVTPSCKKVCAPFYPVPYKDDIIKSSRSYFLWISETNSHSALKRCQALFFPDQSLSFRNTLLKKELFLHGPIWISFAFDDGLAHYKSGIYQMQSFFKGRYHHAARLLGWGVENDMEYWLIANSASRRFGEFGYLKVPIDYNISLAVAGLYRE